MRGETDSIVGGSVGGSVGGGLGDRVGGGGLGDRVSGGLVGARSLVLPETTWNFVKIFVSARLDAALFRNVIIIANKKARAKE